jgi:hypothetical protein
MDDDVVVATADVIIPQSPKSPTPITTHIRHDIEYIAMSDSDKPLYYYHYRQHHRHHANALCNYVLLYKHFVLHGSINKTNIILLLHNQVVRKMIFKVSVHPSKQLYIYDTN